MANFFWKKNRKRAIAVLSVTLAATLSVGVFAACGDTKKPEDDDEPTTSAVDTQLLRNGNFEFYSERDTELDKKRSIIATPTSWSFTSGSPSSDTRSGLIETKEWDFFAKPGAGAEWETISEAVANWTADGVTLYDRLKFYKDHEEEIDNLASSSAEAKLFAEYSYSIDFEDIETLNDDLIYPEDEGKFRLHKDKETDDDGNYTEGGVLMIHNRRTSDKVVGTKQYYTSSTTITLEAGTAAKLTAWVRTDKLTHYAVDSDDVAQPVTQRAGAYICVINTVGGTTLDEMQIKNINTDGQWQQYTVYVRASTYASTTFRVKLGLGQGTSSDDRYYDVDGYAFFDDIAVEKLAATQYPASFADKTECSIDSSKDDKLFNMDVLKGELNTNETRVFGLDLYGGKADDLSSVSVSADLSEEVVNSEKTVQSKVKGGEYDIKEYTTYGALKTKAGSNGYLENIFPKDFEDKFPFKQGEADANASMPVIMLLSASKAAYTAKMTSTEFSLAAGEQMLISFFVKTSEIRSGKTGASVTVIDGNKRPSSPTISAFDSTTIATVDIDKKTKDIYDGWVQCFLFIRNNTEDTDAKTFSLEFSFGPTSIANSSVSDYAQGYAAFANFEFKDLTKTEYSYASTNSRAVKVDLTAKVVNSDKFDDAQASSKIEEGLAAPASFEEVLAGSEVFNRDGKPHERPEGIYAGLLNADYAKNYEELVTKGNPWASALNTVANATNNKIKGPDWWSKIFGDANVLDSNKYASQYAQQPLVLINTSGSPTASYGFVASSTSISANSTRKISLRVKVAADTTVYIYLIDTTEITSDEGSYKTILTPTLPKATYWYDDDGNIVKGDPTDEKYNAKTDVLFYLEENGLYTKAENKNDKNKVYYANLANYDKDDDNNLVTSNGKIAFYYNEKDETANKYYAYRTGSEDKYEYSQKVLPLEGEIDAKYVRYTAPTETQKYQSVIAVTGTEETKDQWIDVSFNIRTGSKAKNYRLELWAGERDNETDGFPENGYVFFDKYSGSGTADFATRDDIWVKKLLEEDSNLAPNPDYTPDGDESEKLEDRLNDSLALYYTFTFYDSIDYLRYDATTDKDGTADKWTNYNQSSRSEGLLWLKVNDLSGDEVNPFYSLWIDYSVVDVDVSPDPSDSGSSGGSSSGGTSSKDDKSNTNIWLILSSVLLAAVLLFAIVAVIVRRILRNRPKTTKVKKAKRSKKVKSRAPAPEEEEETETPAEPSDNPYDE